MSKTAAPQAAQTGELRELWCAGCGEPVLAGGHTTGLVVHTETDAVFCGDGAIASPTWDRGVAAGAAERTALQADHPGWRIWRSDEGRWWATRRGNRPREPRSIDADTAAALSEELAADAKAMAPGAGLADLHWYAEGDKYVDQLGTPLHPSPTGMSSHACSSWVGCPRSGPRQPAGPPLAPEKMALTCVYVARSEGLEPPTF